MIQMLKNIPVKQMEQEDSIVLPIRLHYRNGIGLPIRFALTETEDHYLSLQSHIKAEMKTKPMFIISFFRRARISHV